MQVQGYSEPQDDPYRQTMKVDGLRFQDSGQLRSLHCNKTPIRNHKEIKITSALLSMQSSVEPKCTI